MPSYNDNDSYYSYECEIKHDETETDEYEEQQPYMTYDEEMEAFQDAEAMKAFYDYEEYYDDEAFYDAEEYNYDD